MLSVIYAECRKEARTAESHYAEFRYAECRYVECRGVKTLPKFSFEKTTEKTV